MRSVTFKPESLNKGARLGVVLFLIFCALGLGLSKASASHAHPAIRGTAAMDVIADPTQAQVVDVLLTESDAKGVAKFIHLRSSDGGATWGHRKEFQAPAPIFSPHRGNDPQIASFGETLVILWTQPGTSKYGSGPLGAMRSTDGGRTWKKIAAPPDDGSTDGHGYIDLVTDQHGHFHAVWLDARDQKQGLRYSRLDAGANRWSKNQTLDASTCECCMNKIYSEGDRLFVLYRDIQPRDMALVVSADGGKTWRRESTVGDFQWDFKGCPHVGGALAVAPASAAQAESSKFALAWTGHDEKAGLYLLSASPNWKILEKHDASARWFDIARNSRGQLAYIWGAIEGKTGAILARQSSDGGKSWTPATRISPTKQSALAPIITGTGDGFLVSWIEETKGHANRWRSQRLIIPPATTSAQRRAEGPSADASRE